MGGLVRRHGPTAVLTIILGVSLLALTYGLPLPTHSGTTVGEPLPGFRIEAHLQRSVIASSDLIQLHVTLTNTTGRSVSIRERDCTTGQAVLWLLDSQRRLVTTPGLMCPLMWVAGSLTVRSHETVGADACIEDLRESSQCGPIGVPLVRGSYWVGGTYYGQPIPEQRLDVVTDDVFEALGRGTLLDQEVSSPADGLRLATSVTRYQKGPNNVYRALVTLTNVGSHAVAFPVIDCDPPFRAKIPDPVGPPPTYGAPPGWPYGEGWLQHWHLECPTSFAPTEEWLAPGSSVEAALCFQYWQMGTSWFCAPLEPTFVRQAVTFHMTGFFYDLAVPETTFTIGP